MRRNKNNEAIYLAALQEYYEKCFIYLELGDGDELWENRSMEEIIEKHGDVFALMKKFYCSGRMYMLYGNHDLKKLGIKDPTSAAKNYRKKERVEKRMAGWAKKNQQALIAGHTHRPYFSKEGSDGWYYNAGNRYIRVEKETLEGSLSLNTLLS